MTPSDTELRREAAIHEAGHVVACRAMGYEVTGAEAFHGDNTGLGHMTYRLPMIEDSPAGRSRRLVVLLAGNLANYLVGDREGEGAWRVEADLLEYLDDPDSYPWFGEEVLDDDGQALRLLQDEAADPHGAEPRELLRETIRETIELLRERRAELEAVAAELAEDET